MITSLVDALKINDRDVVAFVGGGGKSTLVLACGKELSAAGRPAVMATTTKMGVDQIPDWATMCHTAEEVEAALGSLQPVYLLHRAEDAKVIGVDPALIDTIAASTQATVLIEADGSRGRPFKAPADHEPVIPSSVTLVVVVVGADALGVPIGETAHRPQRVAALSGRSLADPVGPRDIATVVSHPEGGRRHVPAGARMILAVTKVAPQHSDAVTQIRGALPFDIDLLVVDSY